MYDTFNKEALGTASAINQLGPYSKFKALSLVRLQIVLKGSRHLDFSRLGASIRP